jgi:glycosyltransferase involved in cell wall biosynthesis
MKILLLSDINSTHTIKWAKSLAEKNIDIYLYGFNPLSGNWYSNYKNIQISSLNIAQSVSNKGNIFQKLNYLKSISNLKKIVKNFKPDIVHAHYASSYGLLGNLLNFHPFMISVWGSDVYDFPNLSFFHKKIVKLNFKKADKILSTSHVMAFQTKKFTNKEIEVTPFGIDLEKFKKIDVPRPYNKNDIVIGTIKTLEKIYGIEYLIQAFHLLVKKLPQMPLRLLIVGGGSQEKELKQLAQSLEISDMVTFTGKIAYQDIVNYHNIIDIFVALSINESFGVAIIEAGACEKPVVVSNVGGLPEVVDNNKTGFIVESKNPIQAAEAIEKLILNSELRLTMGKSARNRVNELFNWENNITQMIEIYSNILSE